MTSYVQRVRRGAAAAAGVLVLAALPACAQGEQGERKSPAGAPAAAGSLPQQPDAKSVKRDFQALEKEFDARIGVYALDTGTGRTVGHRPDERFAYASTFKALAAGAVLRKYGVDGMDKVIRYSKEDIVANSPISEAFVDTGMSLRELCAATVWYSDNTAVNLLLEDLGGPDALQAVLAEFGDDVTQMDRYEPDMSEGRPGDVRDTSTPRALTGSLRAMLLGDALKRDERDLLATWMRTNTTGETLIAAGTPDGWTVADKSGTAGYGGRNDIAVLWPENGGNPVLLSVLTTRDKLNAERRDEVVAKAAAVALKGLGRG
ncbi:class A beta-lactamase [Streptomyces sp. NPDC048290]|uniref:class A beta-lactamase n=1 Tax=Streptomyces sp. NPDC048290 TaxID=3155811 RepID=UPI00342ED4E7